VKRQPYLAYEISFFYQLNPPFPLFAKLPQSSLVSTLQAWRKAIQALIHQRYILAQVNFTIDSLAPLPI
jgi:hypothetical protein